jgi:hypothetical protein
VGCTETTKKEIKQNFQRKNLRENRKKQRRKSNSNKLIKEVKVKVKISLLQAMEAHRVARG